MAATFTRRNTPAAPETFEWLVLVGETACTEHYVRCQVPDERRVRKLLQIAQDTPILIGRP